MDGLCVLNRHGNCKFWAIICFVGRENLDKRHELSFMQTLNSLSSKQSPFSLNREYNKSLFSPMMLRKTSYDYAR